MFKELKKNSVFFTFIFYENKFYLCMKMNTCTKMNIEFMHENNHLHSFTVNKQFIFNVHYSTTNNEFL